MHGNEVFQRVQDALTQVEAERDVRVLFACESGSRAWGFASRDSDYDVRFLYVHRRDWYLSVEDRRDVIERPIADDLDVSGWELRKALRLLRKSNPPLLEWLQSPVVYRRNPVFATEFGALASEFYSPRRCFAHYLHMAFGNWSRYLRDREQVSLKKYLYTFRPLLACRWIERGQGQPIQNARSTMQPSSLLDSPHPVQLQSRYAPNAFRSGDYLRVSRQKRTNTAFAPVVYLFSAARLIEIQTNPSYEHQRPHPPGRACWRRAEACLCPHEAAFC